MIYIFLIFFSNHNHKCGHIEIKIETNQNKVEDAIDQHMETYKTKLIIAINIYAIWNHLLEKDLFYLLLDPIHANCKFHFPFHKENENISNIEKFINTWKQEASNKDNNITLLLHVENTEKIVHCVSFLD